MGRYVKAGTDRGALFLTGREGEREGGSRTWEGQGKEERKRIDLPLLNVSDDEEEL